MYETEVYIKTVRENIPQEISDRFFDTSQNVKLTSILHWTEHCTECSMPSCFTTCDLYAPRKDGKCQRFVNGIEKLEQVGINNKSVQILKIRFKKWGVFATQGNNELYDTKIAQQRVNNDLNLSKLIHLIPSGLIKKKFIQKRYSVKKNKIINEQNKSIKIPDGFLMEIYNPSKQVIHVGLTIRNDDLKYSKIPFQYRLELKPGYNKELIPFDEIAKRVKTELAYRINIIPEELTHDTPLYFGITEFVQLKKSNPMPEKEKKIKCVIWDLDNTIWDGILVEDGVENLKLKNGIKDILIQLEKRGIVNSIASKNNHDLAIEALKHFGLNDFFVYPKISWLPKSKSLKDIALDLNIDINTFLFIDDSEFERKEIEIALPQVRLMDAINYKTVLDLKALQVPETKESANRKLFYKREENRKIYSENYEGEYLEFLKTCNIELEIEPFKEEYFERVYELTQRTNQMNFSGNYYTMNDLWSIYNNKTLAPYILSCKDKFGEYGVIGFGIVEKPKNQLIDLMFSCRVQSKRVEHAFLTYILKHYLKRGDFFVKYKQTEKNKFSAQVFNDFGFKIVKQENELKELEFERNKKIPDDGIITITER